MFWLSFACFILIFFVEIFENLAFFFFFFFYDFDDFQYQIELHPFKSLKTLLIWPPFFGFPQPPIIAWHHLWMAPNQITLYMGDIGQEQLFHAFMSSMSSYIFASATFICLRKLLSFRPFFESMMWRVFLGDFSRFFPPSKLDWTIPKLNYIIIYSSTTNPLGLGHNFWTRSFQNPSKGQIILTQQAPSFIIFIIRFRLHYISIFYSFYCSKFTNG